MLYMVVLKGILVEVNFYFWLIKTLSQTEEASSKAYNFSDIYDDI